MVIKKKMIPGEKKKCKVTLEDNGFLYSVKVDGDDYKKTANILFAVQVFNAI